jgi:predicted RNA-binding Zn-ribbon protein involved in translation (DUF1610 family)
MTGLTGEEILLILERQGYAIGRGPAGDGDFYIRPLARLTSLQRSVLAWHLHTIVEAIRRSLALWPCPACGSLAWRSPDAPVPARHWVCGTCLGWGMIDAENPHAIIWYMTRTVH